MRHRFGISCAAISCVGSSILALASCEDSSSSGGNPQLDGSVSPDTSRPDGTTSDVFVPTDGGIDSGFDAGCSPHSLAGFTVPAYVPARRQQVACFPGQYEPFAEACAGDASTIAACRDYPANGADGGQQIDEYCGACLDPSHVDAGRGPLFLAGGVYAPNQAGCVERAAQTDAGFDCAKAISAAAACVEYSCKPSCPVQNEPSRYAYLECARLAATTVCATYTQAAQACVDTLSNDHGDIGQYCFPPDASAVSQFTQLAHFFCWS